MIAWPCHYDFFVRSARSPTFLWSFKSDNSSIWPQWSGEQQFGSQSRIPHRERRRSSNNQCKHRTSSSTQFYKQSQGPRLSSETQPDSYPPHRCSHATYSSMIFSWVACVDEVCLIFSFIYIEVQISFRHLQKTAPLINYS